MHELIPLIKKELFANKSTARVEFLQLNEWEFSLLTVKTLRINCKLSMHVDMYIVCICDRELPRNYCNVILRVLKAFNKVHYHLPRKIADLIVVPQ